MTALEELEREIVACRRCPRLVAWREQVAREKRAAFAGETYWGRPIPGFGDPQARLLILGLAPAAHGANRTGRVFTGDRSGDFLFAALHRAGLASQAAQRARGRRTAADAAPGSPPPCAVPRPPTGRRPPSVTPACRGRCASSSCCPRVRTVLCLGAFAWAAALRARAVRRARARRRRGRASGTPRSGIPGSSAAPPLVGSYHPSQQNTFTGRLTPAMLDAAIATALELFPQR